MANSLSKLVDNVTKELHETKSKGCDCFLEYGSVNDNLINKCLSCDKNYSNKIDEKLKNPI